MLVGEGRFVPVCDGLNAEVQADPSNRQNTAVVVVGVVVRARRCFILQGIMARRLLRKMEMVRGGGWIEKIANL